MAVSKAHQFGSSTVALARYAKALSHPARVSILKTLARKPRCICGEIVEGLPLAQSTVSQHLQELKKAGLITGEIEGLTSCYCLNENAIREFEQIFGSLLRDLNKSLNRKKCC